MQVLKCVVGRWHVEAKLEDMAGGKRMAIIAALADYGGHTVDSRHTVVFDHVAGCDQIEEAKEIVRTVLKNAH